MAENSGGQEQKRPEQSDDRAHAYADDAKRERDEPHQRREDQHRERHWPRQDQQDAPENQKN